MEAREESESALLLRFRGAPVPQARVQGRLVVTAEFIGTRQLTQPRCQATSCRPSGPAWPQSRLVASILLVAREPELIPTGSHFWTRRAEREPLRDRLALIRTAWRCRERGASRTRCWSGRRDLGSRSREALVPISGSRGEPVRRPRARSPRWGRSPVALDRHLQTNKAKRAVQLFDEIPPSTRRDWPKIWSASGREAGLSDAMWRCGPPTRRRRAGRKARTQRCSSTCGP